MIFQVIVLLLVAALQLPIPASMKEVAHSVPVEFVGKVMNSLTVNEDGRLDPRFINDSTPTCVQYWRSDQGRWAVDASLAGDAQSWLIISTEQGTCSPLIRSYFIADL